MPRLSNASRTVLVMLLGIAFFELGISHRFGALWNMAFSPKTKKEPVPQQTPDQSQGTPPSNQPPVIPM